MSTVEKGRKVVFNNRKVGVKIMIIIKIILFYDFDQI
jgi:hypothetical protein